MASQRASRAGAVLDPGDTDEVDAQLSALLESIEADVAAITAVRGRSGRAAAGVSRRPRRRGWKSASKRERARRERRRPKRVPSGAGFAPKAVGSQPAWARIPYLGDPAVRETAYYLIAAVVLASGLGLLCARLLT